MSDDIVTRLLEQVCECGYSASFDELHKCLRCDAADEIERLREELEASRSAVNGFIQMLGQIGKNE